MAPDLLTTVRRIEKRGALEIAHRALGNCGQVFRYAIATGRAKRDPTGDLRGALCRVSQIPETTQNAERLTMASRRYATLDSPPKVP